MSTPKKKIPLFWPFNQYWGDILEEIRDTLQSRWWGQGKKVDKFERLIGKKWGYAYPLMTNSGTSALELAYHIIGLKSGDSVITPVLTCTATNIPLLRRGVNIVFADVEKETLNIDPVDVEKKITSKTKAIVVVHLGGIPVNDEIFRIAKQHNIPVVVDAAQHHVGRLKGDFIVYSFQAIKNTSTSDGGLLVLSNEPEYKRAKLLRWFGIDRDQKAKQGWQAWSRRQMTFDIQEAGFKFQPTDFQACFGLANISRMSGAIKYRMSLVRLYSKLLMDIPQVKVVAGGSAWLMGIIVEDRDNLAQYLLDRGIENNLVHLRNDLFAVFKPFKNSCPNMDEIEGSYLYLPINHLVTRKDVVYICKRIREFYGR